MNQRFAIRAAVLSVVTTAALAGSPMLLAHDQQSDEVNEQTMMHQMNELRAANRAMRQAPPERRDHAMAEHRHDMMHMMQMMRRMDGMGGMDEMPGEAGHRDMPTAAGGGSGMGMGMGKADGSGPRQMQQMTRRMDRMEAMMSEMLDHMDMYEQHHTRR